MGQTKYEELNEEILKGNFTSATKMMKDKIITSSLSDLEIYNLNFQILRLERIRKDFRMTAEDVLNYVRKYYPDADEKDLSKWRDDGTLEYKIIDGQIKYFNRSHTNLFRVNEEARKQKELVQGYQKNNLYKFLENYLPGIVEQKSAASLNL
jgi:hypothetical protein